jgi:hypothetical protein
LNEKIKKIKKHLTELKKRCKILFEKNKKQNMSRSRKAELDGMRNIMSEKILLSSQKKQYKANLHCHSTRSDGKLTPEQLKQLYKENGYDVLAITDHCNPKDHSSMSTPDFLLITGYEAYIRPSEKGKYNAYEPEVHLNLFARDPKNETIICYNEKYTKYVTPEERETLKRAGSERTREYTTEYVNEFINTAIENGYIVAYNHPYWSMEDEARILSYENCFSLEMYNTSSYVVNNIESGEILYDTMLRCGKKIGCHAADDNHNVHPFDSVKNDSCGFYTMILADELEYGQIFEAFEKQECYASNGPSIYEIKVVDGESVHVECSAASSVFLYVGSKAPKSIRVPKGETITSVDLPLPPEAKYIRVAVYDEEGKKANSRGFFPEEWA